jgi:phosphoadenosine phosphosulfate reductase
VSAARVDGDSIIGPAALGDGHRATRLRDLLGDARRRFGDDADPVELLGWFGTALGTDRVAVAVSFADALMPTLAARALTDPHLLFVDTGYHFVETLGYRDAVAHQLGVTVRSLTPVQSVAEQDAAHGVDLWSRDPDACCALRKRAPMDAALAGYDAWASGIRRADGGDRASTPLLDWDDRRAMIKVNPLAAYSDDQVAACVARYGLLENPLTQIGYRSIGCAPCTRPVSDDEDPRAGRWPGRPKTECGLHL